LSKDGISSGKQFSEYLEAWRFKIFESTKSVDLTGNMETEVAVSQLQSVPDDWYHKCMLAFIVGGVLERAFSGFALV
jgi:hypothetical protein